MIDVPETKQGTHHGVLDGATVRTDCGASFQVSGTLRLDLPPGESPLDPEQICSECRIIWGRGQVTP